MLTTDEAVELRDRVVRIKQARFGTKRLTERQQIEGLCDVIAQVLDNIGTDATVKVMIQDDLDIKPGGTY